MDVVFKKAVVTALIAALEDDLKIRENAWQEAVDDAAEAEGAMQTRYGSTKEEKDLLASSYGKQIQELRGDIQALDVFTASLTNSHTVVASGALFKVKTTTDQEMLFMILPVGGHQVEVDEQKVFVLSKNAPLASVFTGKHLEEEVCFRDTTYTILEIV